MKHLLLVVVYSTSNCNGRRVFAGGKIGEDIAFWFEKVVKKGNRLQSYSLNCWSNQIGYLALLGERRSAS